MNQSTKATHRFDTSAETITKMETTQSNMSYMAQTMEKNNEIQSLSFDKSDYADSNSGVVKVRNQNYIKTRKIRKLRTSKRGLSSNQALKMIHPYSEQPTPTSSGGQSTSNYTDYLPARKVREKSPDRLKILKTTIRMRTASSDNNANVFLPKGLKKTIYNSNRVSADKASLPSSVYKSEFKKQSDGSSTAATPVKVVPKSKPKMYSEIKPRHQILKPKKEEVSAPQKTPHTVKKPAKNLSKVIGSIARFNKTTTASAAPVEDEGKYQLTKDIKPLKNPEKQFKNIYKDLICLDWEKQIEA